MTGPNLPAQRPTWLTSEDPAFTAFLSLQAIHPSSPTLIACSTKTEIIKSNIATPSLHILLKSPAGDTAPVMVARAQFQSTGLRPYGDQYWVTWGSLKSQPPAGPSRLELESNGPPAGDERKRLRLRRVQMRVGRKVRSVSANVMGRARLGC